MASQKIKLGTLKVPDYFNKCQIIEMTGWTERQYLEENSLHFLEGQFAVYLEAKARVAELRAKKQGRK